MLLHFGGLEFLKPERRGWACGESSNQPDQPCGANHGLQALRGEAHAFRHGLRGKLGTERFDGDRAGVTHPVQRLEKSGDVDQAACTRQQADAVELFVAIDPRHCVVDVHVNHV